MRGIAVMMVFVYHLEDILNLLPGFENYHSFWKNYGYSAPDLFFVISGYIMCFVTFELRFKPVDWLVRRFLRIYPIFWVFASISVLVWLYDPSLTMGSDPQNWLSVSKFLLLFPQQNTPLLFVAWTLEHEIVFYSLVFLVAALGGKSRTLVIVVGVLTLLGVLKAAFQETFPALEFWDYHIFSLYMMQFFMGALIFEFRAHIEKTGVKKPLIAGLIVFALSGIFTKPMPLDEEHISKVFMFGLSHSLFLIGAINWELARRKKIGGFIEYKRRPFLVQMGDASYSIYLAHPFCLSICGKVLIATGLTGVYAFFALCMGGVISLFVGWSSYHLLEKPGMHLSKYILSKNKKPKEVPAST
jgi:peptidoglycan/LPS O-acetylase OafA/YrhL